VRVAALLWQEEMRMPKCGRKTEVYSRIVGYLRPVQNWNDGKAAEFHDRKTLDSGWDKVAPGIAKRTRQVELQKTPAEKVAAD